MSEDFFGAHLDRDPRDTASGTTYHVCKWICPGCGKACSYLEIDGEWCHGDSMVIQYRDGVRSVKCSACWLASAEGAQG
jgi:LSD1 subclass zinc finger protein